MDCRNFASPRSFPGKQTLSLSFNILLFYCTVSPAKETWMYGLTKSLVCAPNACLRFDMMDEFILGSPSALYTLTINLALCLELVTPTGTRRLASIQG